MLHGMELKLAFIGFAGIAAQWLAWRFNLPAIAVLLLAGLLAGPFTGFLDPAADFGDVYKPVITLSVALILFEGGLTLNFRQIRETSTAVRRIIIAGGPLVWLFGTLAGHFAGGLSWQTAIILGALLVVTGPTVIMPLLRQAGLKQRPASLLRWEAIINDPIGALLAVISFEVFLVLNNVNEVDNLLVNGLIAALIALPGAWFFAKGIAWLFIYGHIPEFLKAPVLIAAAVSASAITNHFLEEAGLLTVTVMGIALANARLASLTEMRRFKETITVLLVSVVFILMTASLQLETILSLGWDAVAFVLATLFVVRPLAIFIATINAGLTWQERLLTAWIAPRGVVAVAVAGLFGSSLVNQGIEDGGRMIAYTFAVVAATIILHGFSLPLLARLLDLRVTTKPGILFVGSSPWTIAFAGKLQSLDVPVLLADHNWNRLQQARSISLPSYYGDVLSENAHHEINLSQWDAVIAASDNEAYNALVCTELGPDIGRTNVFQIGARSSIGRERGLHFTVGGRQLMESGMEFEELNDRLREGWQFISVRLSKDTHYGSVTDRFGEKDQLICWMRPSGDFVFPGRTDEVHPPEEATLVIFGPGDNGLRKSNGNSPSNALQDGDSENGQ